MADHTATGDAAIEQVGSDPFRLIFDVASGHTKTWAEQWRLHNTLALFYPGPVTSGLARAASRCGSRPARAG